MTTNILVQFGIAFTQVFSERQPRNNVRCCAYSANIFCVVCMSCARYGETLKAPLTSPTCT
jgi:hypothetical protein